MKAKITVLVLLCALLLGGCAKIDQKSDTASSGSGTTASSVEQAGAYHKVTAEEAKKMIDAGGVIIVDVRRADEYADKHISGALLIPNETIGSSDPELLPDKEAVLLVYCRTGVRSKQAADKLVKLGYTNVYDFGGITDWPYDTESGAFAQ